MSGHLTVTQAIAKLFMKYVLGWGKLRNCFVNRSLALVPAKNLMTTRTHILNFENKQDESRNIATQ